jgi:hypothetical protein
MTEAKSSETTETPFASINKLYLETPPLSLVDRKMRVVIDYSYLPYVFEEMISIGVGGLVVDYRGDIEQLLQDLPDPIQKRVQVVRDTDVISRKVGQTLLPVHKIGREVADGDNILEDPFKLRNVSALMASDYIAKDLSAFWIAAKNKACVHVRIRGIRACIESLREVCSAPEAGAVLATISGVFSTYQQLNLETAVFRATEGGRDQQWFLETLLNDDSYFDMCKHSKLFGVPDRLKTAARAFGRASQKFVRAERNRNLLDFGTKSITAATSIPLPNSAFAESLLAEGYLPPIVYLHKPYEQAYRRWKAHRPEIVEYDRRHGIEQVEKNELTVLHRFDSHLKENSLEFLYDV